MKVFFSDTFTLPLPDGHRFPLDKYRRLRERLERESGDQLQFHAANAATDEQLLLVHTPEYIAKLKSGSLSDVEQRRIGFPASPGLLERSRRSTGATIDAARAALRDGAAVHLAGGTHHAFPDHGQGFCVFNDVAVASRVLQTTALADRIVVIDLDVHQGNGTAKIFAKDPSVFTFSMHGERNYPFSKYAGDLDIALPDGTKDESYLSCLREVLETQLPLQDADLVVYLAGADPYEHDRFGKLRLSKAGLIERDALVFTACQQYDIPIAVVMAGGYAKSIEDIVAIHESTVHALLRMRRGNVRDGSTAPNSPPNVA